MLYAALTAHWPGDEDGSALPAAPASDGLPHAPRQVQAGISHGVDSIVCRCLGIGTGEPLATPADLAKALRGVPRTPLPLFAGLGNAPPASPRQTPQRRPAPQPAPPTQPHRQPPPEPPAASHVPPPRARAQRHASPPPPPSTSTRTTPAHSHGGPKRPANPALIGIAAAALTVIVGLGAWALSGTGGDDDPKGGGATDNSQTSAPPKPSVAKLAPQGVSPAERPVGGHVDGAIGKNLASVIDGKPSGSWETQSYADSDFGRYSKGLGVLLDMGKPVKVANVKVYSPVSGGVLQVRVGDSQSPTDLKRLGEQAPNGGEVAFAANPQATGRYVLVWFTKLPGGPFKGRLGEIAVYGAAG